MISAMLLMVSLVALVQFAVYYWRALIAGMAAAPLSDRVLQASGAGTRPLRPADFTSFLQLHELTPELNEGNSRLWTVRSYYHTVELLGRLTRLHLPSLAVWADREMALCSRYVAVVLDQRLERNLACAADIRSC